MYNIVYNTDANYWMHLYVSLYSLLKNNEGKNIMVYILSDGSNEVFIDNMQYITNKYKLVNYKIIKVDNDIAESFPLKGFVTRATYYRIYIARFLPYYIEKVLYLDCDTIIEAPLDELFSIDLEDYVLGAAPDHYLYDLSNSKRLNLSDERRHFNAGVLLINMFKWRTMDIELKLVNYIKNNFNKIKNVDQDALNAVLHNYYKEISQKYNYVEVYKILNQSSFHETQPSIIHYICKLKPWHYLSDHPLKERYWFYLRETPYRDYVEEDRHLINIVIKPILSQYNLIKEVIKSIKVKLIKNVKFINKIYYSLK